MNTRMLMTASALFMGLLGVLISFLPQELLTHLGASPIRQLVIVVQVTGALYLGFAGLNWMARANVIGGIYSRPVALANFLHFGIVSVLLLKAVVGGHHGADILVGAAAYAVFGVSFGWVLFTHPQQQA